MSRANDTTSNLRAAREGDAASLTALVERFSPWLLVQARHRLGATPICDAEDLVHDVWVITLPRLATLEPRSGRLTPVLVRFLAQTLLYRLQNLIEQHIVAERRRVAPSPDLRLSELPDRVSDAMRSVHVRERHDVLWRAISELSPRERQVVVMRGIEQHAVKEIGAVLGLVPNTVSVVYRRACDKLRGRLGSRMLRDLAGT